MGLFIAGCIVVYIVFRVVGDAFFARAQEAVEAERRPAKSGCIALASAFVFIALGGVAFVIVSMMAIAAGGTW